MTFDQFAITHPFSAHPVLHIRGDEDWTALIILCDGFINYDDIERFRQLIGRFCRTIVVERQYFCKDYRDTYTNFYAKKFATYPGLCQRLLFFTEDVEPAMAWDISCYAHTFIGYSVIRPTRIKPIGRTVLNPKYCDGVSGYMCISDFQANLLGVPLKTEGFPFISQDNDVTVCAHAACWMCFRYFSEKYNFYREIFPYQITQLTTNLSFGRLSPVGGVYLEQIVEMFSRYGFYPLVYHRENWQRGEDPLIFDRLLYYYIESGLAPVVIVQPPNSGSKHAFVAIGHTSDPHILPPANRTFSSSYLTGLVIQDDNELPYQKLAMYGHVPDGNRSRYQMSQIDNFIVPLPEKVHLTAQDVERLVVGVLEDTETGLAAKSPTLPLNDLVLRIFLTSSRAYKEYCRKADLPHGLSTVYTQLLMPRLIWVAELSTKQGYPNERVLGEILWDATAVAEDKYGWLAVHYPQYLIVNDRHSHRGGLEERSLSDSIDYTTYKHNLHAVNVEASTIF